MSTSTAKEIVVRSSRRKFGMWFFLASEVMFFTSLFGGVINMRFRSPAGANHVLNIPTAAANTLFLIISSTFVVLALNASKSQKNRQVRWYLIGTFIMGAAFLTIQVIEFTNLIRSGFIPADNLFASGFFTLTGFHGLHVLTGLLWLTGLLITVFYKSISSLLTHHIEMFGLFWHFVDIVWIIIFTTVYLI
ncbi:MAG: cytochrome c oxidase subunit 3 [Anaerolineae bacterium]